ncbi:hypothetical protein BJV82DRAFT_620886, partial [Fennellomyces sp. T-0311]
MPHLLYSAAALVVCVAITGSVQGAPLTPADNVDVRFTGGTLLSPLTHSESQKMPRSLSLLGALGQTDSEPSKEGPTDRYGGSSQDHRHSAVQPIEHPETQGRAKVTTSRKTVAEGGNPLDTVEEGGSKLKDQDPFTE